MIFAATSTDHYLDLARRNTLPLMKNFLDAGHSVIIDKAFGNYAYVKAFIDEVRRHKIAVYYYKLNASLEELLRRNKARQHYIPEWRVEEIYRFHERFRHSQGIEINTEKYTVEQIVDRIRKAIERKS